MTNLEPISHLLNLSKTNLVKNSFTQRDDLCELYFEELSKEIVEAKDEMKPNNAIYLEDEMGDILWDYIMLLRSLEKHGYIRSIESVLERAKTKYSERLAFFDLPEESNELDGFWKKVKEKQKADLARMHTELYE